MFEAVKHITVAAKELNLGVGGFFALVFMALFVWGARRSIEFTSGLAGEWRKLIDEGQRARIALKLQLQDAENRVAQRQAELDTLRADFASLQRRCLALETELALMRKDPPQ